MSSLPHRAAGPSLARRFVRPALWRALAGACLGLCAVEAAAADNLQIYGLVGSYAGSIKRSDNVERATVVGSGGLTTSWWGIRGGEDLGGGTRAIFQLEQFFQPDTGGAGRSPSDPGGFSRSAWVGFSGGFGQLTVGRHTSPYYVSMQMVNPFGASVVFSPLVLQSYVSTFGGVVIGDTVWNNVVQYVSPTVAGLNATVLYAPGEVAGNAGVNNAGVHLRYVQGHWSAVLSAQRVRTAAVAPSTGQQAWLAGAAYDAGWAKLYASAQRTENAVTDIASRTWQLGTSVPVTQGGSVLASVARTTVERPALAQTARNTGALGYDLFLSRRTDVYVTYLYDRVQGRASGNSYALGIRHTF
ncbi:porin [Massilia forsythiae]|uniref:Porin n=1 Tax=Massilia forsythiae TaxID=2728020 RepID=A0A7Z2ZUQ5_9BURK|nr:porin [Massilia forsythiae]QJE02803.1 porin [Massilia forsythiae]